MSKEKQILHMLLDGYSQRRIASTLCVSSINLVTN